MKLKLKNATLSETMKEIESWELRSESEREKYSHDGRKPHNESKPKLPKYGDPLDGSILRQAKIECAGGHVWYNTIKVQFPNALREQGRKFTADLRPVIKNGAVSFYSAVKGTIFDRKLGSCVG